MLLPKLGLAAIVSSLASASAPEAVDPAPAAHVAERPSVTARQAFDAPACASVRASATTVQQREARSFALLTGGAGERAGATLRHQGETYGGKLVWYVRWDRVWLWGDGALCQAYVFEAMPPVASSDAGQAALPVAPDDPRAKVRRVGASSFEIDRGAFERVLANPAAFVGMIKVTPAVENGRPVGVALRGIKPGSLLGAMGLEDGDRLDKINGFELSSPERALEAYARLRVAERMTLTLTRRGRTMDLDFDVR